MKRFFSLIVIALLAFVVLSNQQCFSMEPANDATILVVSDDATTQTITIYDADRGQPPVTYSFVSPVQGTVCFATYYVNSTAVAIDRTGVISTTYLIIDNRNLLDSGYPSVLTCNFANLREDIRHGAVNWFKEPKNKHRL